MCTAIINKGKDLICGFNLDIDPAVWNYSLIKNDSLFTVAITVEGTTYYTHGVTANGNFSNIPYMNGNTLGKDPLPKNSERIDLITHRYLNGEYTFDNIKSIIDSKAIVNVPNLSMHSLICDSLGRIIILEPELGYKEVTENYAVLANFPVLTELTHYEDYFGKDRYDRAQAILSKNNPDFSPLDALNLLNQVKQTGQWATRLSFVYSRNENCVYYAENGDFDNVQKHYFPKEQQSSLHQNV